MRRVVLITVTLVLLLGNNANSSTLTIGPDGINSKATGLTGASAVIGMSEAGRSAKADLDTDVMAVHDQVTPTAVFFGSGNAGINQAISNHATQVAGVMIATNGPPDASLEGVSPSAQLHSGAHKIALSPQQDAALSMNKIAEISNMRAVNLSFGFVLQEFVEQPDGNAFPTQFIDWSTENDKVLYVVAGDEDFKDLGTPADNFNGITVGSSRRVLGAGAFRQSSSFNDTINDPVGPRTAIDIIAPGEDLALTQGMNVSNTTATGTSYAAPHVTGTVALLQQFAEQEIPTNPLFDSDARLPQVMKSVILNSADKLNGVHGSQRDVIKQSGLSWPNIVAGISVTQSLDPEIGAGHLNANNALTQFEAGEHNPGPVPLIGWDFDTIGGPGSTNDYVFEVASGGYLAATLAWNRRVTPDFIGDWSSGDTFAKYNDLGDVLNDLDLFLLPANSNNVNEAITSSISSEDNLEHIFFNVETAGMYKLRVRNTGSNLFDGDEYGLAWWFGEATTLPGDNDGDGDVDGDDLNIFENSFGLDAGGDTDGDGDTDGADFLAWQRNFTGPGALTALTAVPEPTTTALTLLALAAFVIRRG